MDALEYFGLDFSWVRGPMYIFFHPDMSDDWKLLIQAAALCVLLIAIYVLDRLGAFVHMKSRQEKIPPLLVALCTPEHAVDVRARAVRRGVIDDKLTAEEEEDYADLPRRAEHVELFCESHRLSGIVLEAGLPRATEKVRKEWEQRLKDHGVTVLLFDGGDCVVATVLGHSEISGQILQWRLPRFLQKAYKRRTQRKDIVNMYMTFSSMERKRILAVVPVLPGLAKDILQKLPVVESSKSK